MLTHLLDGRAAKSSPNRWRGRPSGGRRCKYGCVSQLCNSALDALALNGVLAARIEGALVRRSDGAISASSNTLHGLASKPTTS